MLFYNLKNPLHESWSKSAEFYYMNFLLYIKQTNPLKKPIILDSYAETK